MLSEEIKNYIRKFFGEKIDFDRHNTTPKKVRDRCKALYILACITEVSINSTLSYQSLIEAHFEGVIQIVFDRLSKIDEDNPFVLLELEVAESRFLQFFDFNLDYSGLYVEYILNMPTKQERNNLKFPLIK